MDQTSKQILNQYKFVYVAL